MITFTGFRDFRLMMHILSLQSNIKNRSRCILCLRIPKTMQKPRRKNIYKNLHQKPTFFPSTNEIQCQVSLHKKVHRVNTNLLQELGDLFVNNFA